MIKSKTATLKNSTWCPQPIAVQSFFVKNTTMGGPTAKGHMELMTDFQAGKIFENLRTKEKEKEKGQRQVSLFWAWDDSKNVRNFSMLIIMAVRGRFGLRLFSLSWKYICCSIQTAYCGRNVCPSPYYPLQQIEGKKGGNTNLFNVWLSVHGKPSLAQTFSEMTLKICKICFQCNRTLLQLRSSRRVAAPPASKCRSFGKTESWAWRIITVHFSNWAEAKQFQNLSPPPPRASCSSFPMCHQWVRPGENSFRFSPKFFASV